VDVVEETHREDNAGMHMDANTNTVNKLVNETMANANVEANDDVTIVWNWHRLQVLELVLKGKNVNRALEIDEKFLDETVVGARAAAGPPPRNY